MNVSDNVLFVHPMKVTCDDDDDDDEPTCMHVGLRVMMMMP